MTVKVTNLDETIKRLEGLIDEGNINAALTAGAEHLRNVVMDYPPATEANKPGRWSHPAEGKGQPRPLGYYERGRGQWYPIMQKRTIMLGSFGNIGKSHGRILAKRGSAVAGYKLRPTSETLGRRWAIWSKDRMTVYLGNNATYARAVHDAEKQAKFHAARGWKTIQAVLAAEGQKVVGFVERAIRQGLKK